MNMIDLEMDNARRDGQEKVDKYKILNAMAKKGEILFTGSSLMEQFPIYELCVSSDIKATIYNRGIGGFTTDDMLMNMEDMVFGTEPSKIFINIGSNDIGQPNFKLDQLILNYNKILRKIKARLPLCMVYLMAYYPVNETDKIRNDENSKLMFLNRNNKNIKLANKAVEELALKLGYIYIDVNDGLMDERGFLKREFTVEGIHMYANAYKIILNNLKTYL